MYKSVADQCYLVRRCNRKDCYQHCDFVSLCDFSNLTCEWWCDYDLNELRRAFVYAANPIIFSDNTTCGILDTLADFHLGNTTLAVDLSIPVVKVELLWNTNLGGRLFHHPQISGAQYVSNLSVLHYSDRRCARLRDNPYQLNLCLFNRTIQHDIAGMWNFVQSTLAICELKQTETLVFCVNKLDRPYFRDLLSALQLVKCNNIRTIYIFQYVHPF